MGRLYTELECGCLVSCDGGGGLVGYCEGKGPVLCQFDEWCNEHQMCEECGRCLKCATHEECATSITILDTSTGYFVLDDEAADAVYFIVDGDEDMYQGLPT